MSYLTRDEIENFGFNKIGRNVLISDKTSIYNPQKYQSVIMLGLTIFVFCQQVMVV